MSEVMSDIAIQEEQRTIKQAYLSLLRSIRAKKTKEDQRLIRKAYELAVEAHKKQRRKSGEPYILHPIAVAKICAGEIGLGPTSVVSALLHDVVEDTEVTLEDIRTEFGPNIARIVDGLTKFDNLFDVESPQAENFRKVLSTLAEDARVVLIKMADRLHNMRTIGSMKPHKKLKIASETSFIYAPLAHRLGLYNMKTEFEDRCMEILEPDNYQMIKDSLEKTALARSRYIKDFIKPIKEQLAAEDIKCNVFGRVKAISSIWNKMKSKKVSLEQIYDIFAIRIIIDIPLKEEKLACWKAYSIVTDTYTPIPQRLKDWVSVPKANGYESLHTTVVGPKGRFVEIQIRTERMNEIAEKGLAAHWKYKGLKTETVFDRWLSSVREILENPAEDAIEFINDFKSHLFHEEVYVFTPKGEMKMLPKGATALDFAFNIHTEIGYHCSAIKVNQKLEPMGYKLRNGDQIQVTTNKNQKPTEDWLNVVVTGKAKNRIRAALQEEKRRLGEYGKETLVRKLRNLKANFDDYNIDFLVKHFGFTSRTDLYYAIAKENIQIQRELKKLAVDAGRLEEFKELIFEDKPEVIPPPLKKRPNGVVPRLLINGEDARQYVYDLANCCHPVQGDDVFAFTTTSGIIKIHRNSCPNATNLLANYGYRVMKAEWIDVQNTDFIAYLRITGVDSIGVVQRLTDVITNKLRINMRSITMEGGEGYYTGDISVVVNNRDQLQHLILTLKNIDGVSNVRRIEPDELHGSKSSISQDH